MTKFLSSVVYANKKEFILASCALIGLMGFIPIFTYFYFIGDLQTKDSIMNRNDTGLTLLDGNSQPFFTFYEAKQKTVVPLNNIPLHMQQAVIAVEDKDFYNHPGFSIKGILRSFIENMRGSKILYGGSTLTQQLVKNALLTPKKSYLRKYQEIVLANEIERRYSKQEILEMYLNSVYFGEGTFGVEEASEKYFNKSAKDLNLTQASYLAAILPAPSQLSSDLTEAKKRQEIVLEKMAEQKYISHDEKKYALNQPIEFHESEEGINKVAPHFALMVRNELIKKFGEESISRSGFFVKTSLNSNWQEYAEKVVKEQVIKLGPNRVSNGSAVILDPKTGEIKALVGSANWYDNTFGKVNIATSLRQPGSSFKPIIYASALEKQIITSATILKDQPTTFTGNYKPQNYDKKFRGPVTARRALANSLNVPSVEIMSKIGVPEGLDIAKRMNISTLQDPSHHGLSLVLGTGEVQLLEMTSAYGIFANNGERNPPVAILEIKDKYNHTIFKHTQKSEKVLEDAYAFLISSILSDNKARAEVFGNALTISRPAAVKTGTTENYKDAWTLGYTPSVVVGVWVGNNDGTAMDNIAGSLGAAPIWRALMEYTLRGTPVEQFTPPATIITKNICNHNGLLLRGATSSATIEYFVRGTEPTQYCFTAPTPSTLKDNQPTQPASSTTPTTIQPIPSPQINNQDRRLEKELEKIEKKL